MESSNIPNRFKITMIKKATLKAVSFLWLGSLTGAGFAFLTRVLLARELGKADFGIFAAALSTVTLLSPLAGFGVQGFWLKIFGQEGAHAVRWLPGSFRFVKLSTGFVVLTLCGWAMWGPHDPITSIILLILSLYIPGQLAIDLVSGKLQLEERYISLALWQLLPHLARMLLVGGVALVNSRLKINAVAYSYSAVAMVFFLPG